MPEYKVIDIEGLGLVEFPDDMSDEEISNTIRYQILKQPKPFGMLLGEGVEAAKKFVKGAIPYLESYEAPASTLPPGGKAKPFLADMAESAMKGLGSYEEPEAWTPAATKPEEMGIFQRNVIPEGYLKPDKNLYFSKPPEEGKVERPEKIYAGETSDLWDSIVVAGKVSGEAATQVHMNTMALMSGMGRIMEHGDPGYFSTWLKQVYQKEVGKDRDLLKDLKTDPKTTLGQINKIVAQGILSLGDPQLALMPVPGAYGAAQAITAYGMGEDLPESLVEGAKSYLVASAFKGIHGKSMARGAGTMGAMGAVMGATGPGTPEERAKAAAQEGITQGIFGALATRGMGEAGKKSYAVNAPIVGHDMAVDIARRVDQVRFPPKRKGWYPRGGPVPPEPPPYEGGPGGPGQYPRPPQPQGVYDEGTAKSEADRLGIIYDGIQEDAKGNVFSYNFSVPIPGRETTLNIRPGQVLQDKFNQKMAEYDAADKKKAGIPPEIPEGPKGECYRNALEYAKENGGRLVHGTVVDLTGKRINHAWVEKEGKVIDPTQGITEDGEKWYKLVDAKADSKYTAEQAMINVVKANHIGPWTPEELEKTSRKMPQEPPAPPEGPTPPPPPTEPQGGEGGQGLALPKEEEAREPFVTRYDQYKKELGIKSPLEVKHGSPEGKKLREYMQTEAQEILDQYRAKYPEPQPIVLSNKEGTRGVIISPSAKAEGKWQATLWDDRGFSGDSQHDTEVEAVEASITGRERYPGKEAFEKLASDPKWTENIIKIRRAQQEQEAKRQAARANEEGTAGPATEILNIIEDGTLQDDLVDRLKNMTTNALEKVKEFFDAHPEIEYYDAKGLPFIKGSIQSVLDKRPDVSTGYISRKSALFLMEATPQESREFLNKMSTRDLQKLKVFFDEHPEIDTEKILSHYGIQQEEYIAAHPEIDPGWEMKVVNAVDEILKTRLTQWTAGVDDIPGWDDFTEKHFLAWLNEKIPLDEHDVVAPGMRAYVRDHPEVLQQGTAKTWREIMDAAEREDYIKEQEAPPKPTKDLTQEIEGLIGEDGTLTRGTDFLKTLYEGKNDDELFRAYEHFTGPEQTPWVRRFVGNDIAAELRKRGFDTIVEKAPEAEPAWQGEGPEAKKETPKGRPRPEPVLTKADTFPRSFIKTVRASLGGIMWPLDDNGKPKTSNLFTDGRVLFKDNKAGTLAKANLEPEIADEKTGRLSKGPPEKDKIDFLKKGDKIRSKVSWIVGGKIDENSQWQTAVCDNEGNFKIVDSSFIGLAKQLYPDCKFYLDPDNPGGPLAVKVGDETVGLIMPMRGTVHIDELSNMDITMETPIDAPIGKISKAAPGKPRTKAQPKNEVDQELFNQIDEAMKTAGEIDPEDQRKTYKTETQFQTGGAAMEALFEKYGKVTIMSPSGKIKLTVPNTKWHLQELRDKLENVGQQKWGAEFRDMGGYAERPKPTPEERQAYTTNPRLLLEYPEIVELAHAVLGGKFPETYKYLFNALGMFNAGRWRIRILGGMDLDTAAKVLAHEIGHALWYLPKEWLNKGNILGGISGMPNYLHDLLEEYPDAPAKILTQADRDRLYAQARSEAGAMSDAEIVEYVTRVVPRYEEAGITAEMILDILRGRTNEPEILLRFLQQIDGKAKAEIAKKAMQDLVDERIRGMVGRRIIGTETITERVVRPQQERPERIAERYRELLKEEILKRKLYEREEIEKELKKLTLIWKTFTPRPGDRYTRYRFSPKELHADAISVLINEPDLLQREAPVFWKALFNYMERKPGFKEIYDELQARRANPEAILEKRRQHIREMAEKGAMLRARQDELLGKKWWHPTQFKPSVLKGWFMRVFAEKDYRAWELTHAKEKEAKQLGITLPDHNHADWWMERLPYHDSEVYAFSHGVEVDLIEPAEKLGITPIDFHEFMELKRAATERADIYNPHGIGDAYADRQLDYMRQKVGDEKFAQIELFVKEFQRRWQDEVISTIEAEPWVDPTLLRYMKDNPWYCTFKPLDKMFEEKFGAYATPRIFRQYGYMGDIDNVMVQTILKGMALIRASRLHQVKMAILRSDVTPVERARRGKGGILWRGPKGKDLGPITVSPDGKVRRYYIDKELANSFEYDQDGAMRVAEVATAIRDLTKGILGRIFIQWNIPWMIKNPVRDISGTWKKLPEAQGEIMKAAYNTFSAAKQAGQEKFPLFEREMLRNHMIPVQRAWKESPSLFGMERDFLRSIQDPSRYKAKVIGPLLRAGDMIVRHQNVLIAPYLAEKARRAGMAGERWGKFTAYQAMKEKARKTGEPISMLRMAHLVRTRGGTPNSYARGLAYTYMEVLFPFSNIGIQDIRSSYEAYKESSGSYVLKTLVFNVLPKIVKWAALSGALGFTVAQRKEMQDAYRKIGVYTSRMYNVFPLGILPDGNVQGIKIPTDYTGQVIGALADAGLQGDFNESNLGALSILFENQPYNVTPFITSALDWLNYYQLQKIPYDPWSGAQLMSEEEAAAGGKYARDALLRATWNQFFGTMLYRFDSEHVEGVENETKKLIGTVPFNALGSFYFITDTGEREGNIKTLKEAKRKEARQFLELRHEKIENINATTSKADFDQLKELYGNAAREGLIDPSRVGFTEFVRKYRKDELRKFAENRLYRDAMFRATSNEQKVALLQKWGAEMSDEEFRTLKRWLYANKLISNDVLIRAIQAKKKQTPQE